MEVHTPLVTSSWLAALNGYPHQPTNKICEQRIAGQFNKVK